MSFTNIDLVYLCILAETEGSQLFISVSVYIWCWNDAESAGHSCTI